MPRPANTQPTDGELEILRILWQIGPAELGQIRAELLKDRQVAPTTVATMLKVMLDKGLVARQAGPRSSLWKARVTRESASTGMLGKLLDSIFDGSAKNLVAHLIEDGQLTPAQLKEIRAMLDEHQRRQK